jgi:hypothetical protein
VLEDQAMILDPPRWAPVDDLEDLLRARRSSTRERSRAGRA